MLSKYDLKKKNWNLILSLLDVIWYLILLFQKEQLFKYPINN